MNPSPYVLVIDDENHICESCNRIFSNAGFRVDTSIDATNGFRQALINPYDAIVLDLNLIESDGLDLLSGIRKRKPVLPVVIITGYPTEESRRMSTTLGVSDYIIKPFEPSELLEPVERAIAKDNIALPGDKTILTGSSMYEEFHYFQSSWFQLQSDGLVRLGGYVPDLSENQVKSIKLPDVGNLIYRGLPLAEVLMENGSKRKLYSPVSGLVTGINQQLKERPELMGSREMEEQWMVTGKPVQIEKDLLENKTRQILVLKSNPDEKNEFTNYLDKNGYVTRFASDFRDACNILADGIFKVITIDGQDYPDLGPRFAKKLNKRFPDIKLIVFNEPDEKMETLYRRNKIFYYGVNPFTRSEIEDLLHCAFNEDKRIMLKNPQLSRFLPNNIHKISIINRHSQKVTLMSYDNILQNICGIGYLLSKELLGMGLPLDINYSRFQKRVDDPSEIEDLSREKAKNDRIIIIQKKDMGKITGCIEKDYYEYSNQDSKNKMLINICIQPGKSKNDQIDFDYHTTIALKNIIKTEMITE